MRHKYEDNPDYRKECTNKMKCQWRRKAADATFCQQQKQKQRTARAACATGAHPVDMFKTQIAQGPVHTCVSSTDISINSRW